MVERTQVKPGLGLSLAVFAAAAVMISYGVLKLGVDAHVPIVFSAVLVCIVGLTVLKMPWSQIEEGALNAIAVALQAVVILMIIGMVIGIWLQSGVVPSLIYYGLSILSPSIFLLATLLITSIVSLSTGSSWTTAGTVGIALMGIAHGLGIPAPLTAGVVISGAYFGDKMSPLSDTTNLAPAVAGSNLFDHIRAMVWSTGPTYLIVAVICIVIGMKYAGGTLDAEKISAMQQMMKAEFNIGLLGFLP
ncbi:MAG TPA: Na+/H+ antiporter NhaC family protein, partial [Synergistales bacterium]|nr:Na+/H+ antiporter NhaC family protein [Synergistales bacterium]